MSSLEQTSPETIIHLPDGSTRRFDRPVTGTAIAESIGKRLAKDALAIKIDGVLSDLQTLVPSDAKVEIVTRDNPAALELIRHDAAHVMAEAVQTLYPGTQVTIGPAIATGFYYDFARDEPFSVTDLERIDAKMREIIAADRPFTREVWDRDDAITLFERMGEHYKAELIGAIPADQPISIYRQGEWFDLCRGPHLPSTGRVGGAFKLMKVAGAYWRGDHRNAMLQRIYGTAWRDDKELKAHLTQLEEAEKRDHRRLGREMDLFHLQEEATGSVFWHPYGWTLWRTLENYMRRRLAASDYIEVRTPQLIDRSLWIASGHWDKFGDNMFTTKADAEEDKVFALKPMNCPAHVQIYRQGIKSYRDLPIRMAEFGACHRNEPSGSLHGIMRVRAFTQDDAHIFCAPEQVTEESKRFCDLLLSVYKDLGFEQVIVKFSDRPAKRAGSDETWDRAEAALKEAIEATGLPYEMNPGEGAFYGPKLEFTLRDAIGRDWQCGTLQMDFVLPERLEAEYIGADGQRHRPVMLHRAILGSMERFIGVLIEHYAGKLPLWLAPVQVVVATITQEADAYAGQVHQALCQAGLRCERDLRNEKINLKVREHSLRKVPLLIVVGQRESQERTVALRRLGGKDQEILALGDAVHKLRIEAESPLGDLTQETAF
ncbi:MAG: threonine--tRNA ligase [Azospirillaceae bacterium]|nr:threonine--tRNA ligase [Azospirillaceae bacterium]